MFGAGFGVGLLLGVFLTPLIVRYLEGRSPDPSRQTVDGRIPFSRRPIEKKKPKLNDDRSVWLKEQDKQNDAGLG